MLFTELLLLSKGFIVKRVRTRRNVVNFFELSPTWQIEARSNSDYAEELSYFEPLGTCIPGIHSLWDLEECMVVAGNLKYNGVIGISNCSAMAVKLSNCGTVALTYFI